MKRILIVDDNKDVHGLLVKIFQKNQLLSDETIYDLASSGFEAMALITKNLYDLIICDIEMPEGDGLCLLSQLRECKIEIPFILFTSAPELAPPLDNPPLVAVISKRNPHDVIL